MTTRLAESACLQCGKVMDAASHPEDDTLTPSPGDITICLYCGYVMAFTDSLGFRELTEEEIGELPLDQISRFQRARKAVMDPIGESKK